MTIAGVFHYSSSGALSPSLFFTTMKNTTAQKVTLDNYWAKVISCVLHDIAESIRNNQGASLAKYNPNYIDSVAKVVDESIEADNTAQ